MGCFESGERPAGGLHACDLRQMIAGNIISSGVEKLRDQAAVGKRRRLSKTECIARQHLFDRLGRPGHRALYALSNLPNKYPLERIEAACEAVLQARQYSYKAVKSRLEASTQVPDTQRPTTAGLRKPLQQSGPAIRPIEEYQAFWEHMTQQSRPCAEKSHVDVAR